MEKQEKIRERGEFEKECKGESYTEKSAKQFLKKGREMQNDMQQLGLGYLYLFCASMVVIAVIVLIKVLVG